MATNVTEKDKTLNELIDWAKTRSHEAALSRFDVRRKSDRDYYDGQVNAFREMNSVLDLLPHDMGLRVELDTNETYYLKSGWAERCDGIYGLACGYESSGCEYYAGGITWFEDPGRIAIMNSHVKLAVPFDEHETKTTNQSEDAKE